MGLILVSGEQGVGEATEAVALSLPPLLPTLSRTQHLWSAQLCRPLRPPQHLRTQEPGLVSDVHTRQEECTHVRSVMAFRVGTL